MTLYCFYCGRPVYLGNDPRISRGGELVEKAGAVCGNMFKTWLAKQSAPEPEPAAAAAEAREKKRDFYVSPKYTWTPDIPNVGNLEAGFIYGNGSFFGLDLNFGYGGMGEADTGGFREFIGIGLCSGKAHNFGDGFQFAYGLSAGVWISEVSASNYHSKYADFLGPFAELRWKFFELSYRGLLGYDYKGNRAGDFGWNNHQLMLGFYFATSKRDRAR